MNQVATIDQAVVDFRDRLTELEQHLDSVPDDQLGDALQWMREQHALMKARNVLGQIVVIAKRLEAKLLRRLGLLQQTTPNVYATAQLNGRERSAATFLATLSSTDFDCFLSDISDVGKVTSDVSSLRRNMDEESERIDDRLQAEQGLSPHTPARERAYIRERIDGFVHEIIMTGNGHPTNSIIYGLAELIGADAEDPVSREGLNQIVRASFGRSDNSNGVIVSAHDQGDYIEASVPTQIAVNYNEWVRVPWESVTVEQLRWYAEYWAEYAQTLVRRASNAEQLLRIVELMQRDHPTVSNCSSLINFGRADHVVTRWVA